MAEKRAPAATVKTACTDVKKKPRCYYVEEAEENLPVDLTTFITYTNAMEMLRQSIRPFNLPPEKLEKCLKNGARVCYLGYYTKPEQRVNSKIKPNELCPPELLEQLTSVPPKYRRKNKYTAPQGAETAKLSQCNSTSKNRVQLKNGPEVKKKLKKSSKGIEAENVKKTANEEAVTSDQGSLSAILLQPCEGHAATFTVNAMPLMQCILPFPSLFKFPVPFKTFKQCINYADAIRQMLKIHAENEYLDFDALEKDENTLKKLTSDYYHLFYMLPKIREKFPFSMRLCPAFAKIHIMDIPESSIRTNEFPRIPLKHICPSLFQFPATIDEFKDLVLNLQDILYKIIEEYAKDNGKTSNAMHQDVQLNEKLTLDLYHRFYMQPEIRNKYNFQYRTSNEDYHSQEMSCETQEENNNLNLLANARSTNQFLPGKLCTLDYFIKQQIDKCIKNAENAKRIYQHIIDNISIVDQVDGDGASSTSMDTMQEANVTTMPTHSIRDLEPIRHTTNESQSHNYRSNALNAESASSQVQEADIVETMPAQQLMQEQQQQQDVNRIEIQSIVVLSPLPMQAENTSSDYEANNGITAKHMQTQLASETFDFESRCEDLFFEAKESYCKDLNLHTTLGYMIQSYNSKQRLLLRTVLNMPLHKFFEHTRIYGNNNLYSLLLYYQLAITDNIAWPLELFMPIVELQKFLQSRDTRFNGDLSDVPPFLLHWSDLINHTDYDECVRLNYTKKVGEELHEDDLLEWRERYYADCCEYNKWLWRVPKLNEQTSEFICGPAVRTNVTVLSELTTNSNLVEAMEIGIHDLSTTQDLSTTKTAQQATTCSTTPATQHCNNIVAPQPETSSTSQALTQMWPASPNLFSSSGSSCATTALNTQLPPTTSIGFGTYGDDVFIAVANTQDQMAALAIKTEALNDPLALDSTLSQASFTSVTSPATTADVSTVEVHNIADDGDDVEVVVKSEKPLLNQLEFIINDDDNDDVAAYECHPLIDEAIVINDSMEGMHDTLINSGSHSLIEWNREINSQDLPMTATEGQRLFSCLLSDTGDAARSLSCTPIPTTSADEVTSMCNISSVPSKTIQPSSPPSSIVNIVQQPRQTQIIRCKNPSQLMHTYGRAHITERVPPLSYTISTDEVASVSNISSATSLTIQPSSTSSTSSVVNSVQQTREIQITRWNPSQIMHTYGKAHISDKVPQLTHTFRALPFMVEIPMSTPVTTTTTTTNTITAGNSMVSRSNNISSITLSSPHTVVSSSQALNVDNTILNDTQLNYLLDGPILVSKRTVSLTQGPTKALKWPTPKNSSETRNTYNAATKANGKVSTVSHRKTAKATTTGTATFVTRHVNPAKVNTESTDDLHPRMSNRVVVYRSLRRLNYFERLTLKHVADYTLPNVGLNCPYIDLQLKCGKTTFNATCHSLATLLPQCERQLIEDVQYVLHSLKEFHYRRLPKGCFGRNLNKSCNGSYAGDDLRKRVLVHFFNALPPFGLCNLRQNRMVLGDMDRVQCEPYNVAHTLSRMPHAPLTKAINPCILQRMSNLKKEH